MGLMLKAQLGVQVDKAAASFDRQAELPSLYGVGLPGAETVAVFVHHVQSQVGIDRVVLGVAGVEGFSKTSQALWIDRIEDQVLVLQECIKQRAPGLLQADGDFAVAEAGAQAIGPSGQGFGGMLEGGALDLIGAGSTQANSVLFVAPVQADVSSKGQGPLADIVRRAHNSRCLGIRLRTRWLGLGEGLIAETSGWRHLMIVFWPKRRAGAKLSPNSSAETIREFVTQRGVRSEEHTSELQSQSNLVCRLLLEK